MNEYDPNNNQSPDEWLAISETDRIDLVVQYHQTSNEPIPESGWDLHGVYHCLIENQLALKEEMVGETLEKLQKQGLSRHDSIHALAAVMTEEMFPVIRDGAPFNAENYRKRLAKITAKRWLKSKY